MNFDFKEIFKSGDKYAAHLKRSKEEPRYLQAFKEYNENKQREYWKNLKIFEDEKDVPTLPRNLDDFYINRLIELGAIPKDQLEDGIWYYGNYRNSSFGKWDAEKQKFHIIRYKFGYYLWDECYHFQDDDGFALFVPLRKATPEEVEAEESKKK